MNIQDEATQSRICNGASTSPICVLFPRKWKEKTNGKGIVDEEFNRKVSSVIREWLEFVPVLGVCMLSNKQPKTNSINRFKTKLNERLLEHDEDGARVEIIKRLNTLPIWCPYDPRVFKYELAEDLLNRLKEKRIFFHRTDNLVNKEVIHNTTQDDSKIKKIEGVNSKTDTRNNLDFTFLSPEERIKIIKNTLMHHLEIKVKEMREQFICEKHIRNLTRQYVETGVNKTLTLTGIELCTNDRDEIVNELLSKALDLNHKVTDFPEMASLSSEDRDKIKELFKMVLEKTKNLKKQGQSDSDIIHIVKKEIKSCVSHIFPEINDRIDSVTKCRIVEQLIRKALVSTYFVPKTESQEINSLLFEKKENKTNKDTKKDPKKDPSKDSKKDSKKDAKKDTKKGSAKDLKKDSKSNMKKDSKKDSKSIFKKDKKDIKSSLGKFSKKGLKLVQQDSKSNLKKDSMKDSKSSLKKYSQKHSESSLNKISKQGLKLNLWDDPHRSSRLKKKKEKDSKLSLNKIYKQGLKSTWEDSKRDLKSNLKKRSKKVLPKNYVKELNFGTKKKAKEKAKKEDQKATKIKKVSHTVPTVVPKGKEITKWKHKILAYQRDMFRFLESVPELKSNKSNDPEYEVTSREQAALFVQKFKEFRQNNLYESERVANKINDLIQQGLVFKDLEDCSRYEIEEAIERILKTQRALIYPELLEPKVPEPKLTAEELQRIERIKEIQRKEELKELKRKQELQEWKRKVELIESGKNVTIKEPKSKEESEEKKETKNPGNDETTVPESQEETKKPDGEKELVLMKPERMKELTDQLLIIFFGTPLKKAILKFFESVPELKSTDSKEQLDLDEKSRGIDEMFTELRRKKQEEEEILREKKKLTEEEIQEKLKLTEEKIQKKMKTEIEEVIDNILEYREIEMDPKKKKLRNEQLFIKLFGSPLKQGIFDYLEGVPELKSKDDNQKKELDDLSERIAQKIEDLKIEEKCDMDIEKMTKTEIYEVIRIILEKRKLDMETKRKDTIVNQLTMLLFSSPVKDAIFRHFECIPELQSRTIRENINMQLVSERVMKKIYELQDLNISDAHLEEMTRYEIDDAVKYILEMKESKMDPEKKKKSTDKLLKILYGSPLYYDHQPLKRVIAFAKHDMIKVIKKIPEFKDLTPAQQLKVEQMFENIAVKIENLRAQCICDAEVEKAVCVDIKKAVDVMLDWLDMKDIEVTLKQRRIIINDLTDAVMASRHELANFPELTFATAKEMKRINALVEETNLKILEKRDEGVCDVDFKKSLRQGVEVAVSEIFEKSMLHFDSVKKAKLVERLIRKALISSYYPPSLDWFQ